MDFGQSMGKPRVDRKLLLICAALVLAVGAVYWQVWDFGFIRVDDELHVSGNPYVLAGIGPQSVRWAFLSGTNTANWHPLTWLSLMADSDLARILTWVFDTEFGRGNSGVYHLTNLAFHLANTLLLFLLLNRLTGFKWRSAFVALMFGIHPLHVESVAWISERKDVLSTLFWILTTWAYACWVERPNRRRYALIAGLFILGLMSKPMLVTLPITLLLLDYWPLRRINHESAKVRKHESPESFFVFSPFRVFVIEKAPLFALALASCVVTFVVQRVEGAVAPTDFLGVGVRIANALVSYVRYLGLMVLPRGLAPYYPHPDRGLPWWWAPACALGFLAATYLVVRLRRKAPYVLVGWLWYLVTLVPVIGLVQVGGQGMADRYTYIPLIGIFIVIAWGAPDLLAAGVRSGAIRCALLAVAVLGVSVGLMAATYKQVGYWRSDITIWSRAAEATSRNSAAHYNLGCAYDVAGELDLAAREYREAVRLKPGRADAETNLGYVLLRQRNYRQAELFLARALKSQPKSFAAHNDMGLTMIGLRRIDEAIHHFEEAVKLSPRDESARGNLAYVRALKRGDASLPQ